MTESLHHVLFIGAQQSGKSSLTAAWYDIASRTYTLVPDPEDDGTEYVLNLVARVRGGDPPIPNTGGPGFRAQFNVQRNNKDRFRLILTDYPGETVRAALDGDVDVSREQHRDRILEDIEQADRIIFVFHPDELTGHRRKDSGEPSRRQHENLLVLKKFASIDGSRHVKRTWCYISHADVTPDDRMADARNAVRLALHDIGLDVDDDRIVCGMSVRAAKNNRFTFPKSGPAVRLVNDAMTTFETYGTSGSDTPRPKISRWIRRHPYRTTAITLTLIFILIVIVFGYMEAQTRAQWTTLVKEFERLGAETTPTHDRAQALITDLDRWVLDAQSNFDRFFDENIRDRTERLRERLAAVEPPPPPPGLAELRGEITNLLERHGNNLTGFYKDLRDVASDAAVDRQWNQEARREWKNAETFATHMLDGVYLVIDDAWLVTPRFWTRATGRGQGLRLEIWINRPGAPRPFDANTSDGAAIQSSVVDRVQGQKGNFTYRWSGPVSSRTPYRIDDTLYLRVFHLTSWYKWNAQLAYARVLQGGPDGLSLLSRSMKWGDREVRVNVHTVDAQGNRVIIPDSIRAVFEER